MDLNWSEWTSTATARRSTPTGARPPPLGSVRMLMKPNARVSTVSTLSGVDTTISTRVPHQDADLDRSWLLELLVGRWP